MRFRPLSSARVIVLCTLVAVATLVISDPAKAVDLTVDQLKPTQAVNFGSTPLVGGNVTFVRARIGVDGASSVDEVDGILRMFVDGFEVEGSPFYSHNGPITAKQFPSELFVDDWLNFLVVPPVSGDVSFVVEVNPLQVVEEDDYDNNTGSLIGLEFECRKTVDMVYVPINYTFNGSGIPAFQLTKPGVGDAFVRAIFTTGEWNYFRNPLPTFQWSQNVNGTSVQLLNALRDVKVNQLPGGGYPEPEFIYGWLKGNPYSGNGRAIGIPGDTAFGNTQDVRFQRTFAHELGHLFGLGHNNSNTLTAGFDVEHHLANPLGLPQTHAANKFDIMVAGQETSAAFVNNATYLNVLSDSRTQCDEGEAASPQVGPLLRVCGQFDRLTRMGAIDPVMWVERGRVAQSQAGGDLAIQTLSAAGVVLTQVQINTDGGAANCGLRGLPHQVVPFHVLLPASVDEVPVRQVRLVDGTTAQILETLAASPAQPSGRFVSIFAEQLQEDLLGRASNAAAVSGGLRVNWEGADDDGDSLLYHLLYSFNDRQSWLPVELSTPLEQINLDLDQFPATRGPNGWFRLVISDGFNHDVIEVGPMNLGIDLRPEVALISPDADDHFPRGAPIALHASVWDPEEFYLPETSVQWLSDLDGPIATGRLAVVDTLSVGTHKIRVNGTDSLPQSGFEEIVITIDPRDVFDADINDDGNVDVQDLVLAITGWGACPPGPCPADVTGDGVVDVADLVELILNWG